MLVLVLAALAVACSEDLETRSGCPALCSAEVPVRDTIIDPFSLDTAVTGYPLIGSEPAMLLAARGDTVDTRVIVRFDSLTTQFAPKTGDTLRPIVELDSAYVSLKLDPLSALRRGTLTIQAYDVDTSATDTLSATLLPLFRPDRLIGTLTTAGENIVDSINVHLDTAAVMRKLRANDRLRIGFRLAGTQSAQLRIRSREGGSPAVLRYRAPGDTATKIVQIQQASSLPAPDELTRVQLSDYMIVARGSVPPATNEIVVGGLPARRAFLRFGIPSRIVDSTNVIRATLLLQQRPIRTFAGDDTLTIRVELSTAAATVTDISKSLAFVAPISSFRQSFAPLNFASDSVRIVPSDSAVVSIDLAGVLQFYRASGAANVPRAIILRSANESSLPTELRFFSSEAAAALRPKLRITYVPGRVVGLP